MILASDQWPGSELVVKISWPDSGRAQETGFLQNVNEEAEKSRGNWATDRLPRAFCDMDIVFDENSAIESVGRLFENAKFSNGSYAYEWRALRVIVREWLLALTSLPNAMVPRYRVWCVPLSPVDYHLPTPL